MEGVRLDGFAVPPDGIGAVVAKITAGVVPVVVPAFDGTATAALGQAVELVPKVVSCLQTVGNTIS